MKRFVLDASVALGWFLDNPVSVYANRVKQLFLKGARAIVPVLWHMEVANALALAQRRSILSPADAERALIDLDQFVLQALETDSSVISLRQCFVVAREFQLSAYDAVYLDLARREKAPLATLDQQLRAAATRAGVQVIR